jgi:hypothetical protein
VFYKFLASKKTKDQNSCYIPLNSIFNQYNSSVAVMLMVKIASTARERNLNTIATPTGVPNEKPRKKIILAIQYLFYIHQ